MEALPATRTAGNLEPVESWVLGDGAERRPARYEMQAVGEPNRGVLLLAVTEGHVVERHLPRSGCETRRRSKRLPDVPPRAPRGWCTPPPAGHGDDRSSKAT
jgi:hypothetical protein